MPEKIKVTLNRPQTEFFQLPQKFRAFISGFGCLRGTEKVITEYGPMEIQHIDRPMLVLSWSEKNSRFELALSGGAFPKGKGNLYQVSTRQGEFVANGFHGVLCADYSYRSVGCLSEGDKVASFSYTHLETNWGRFQRSSHADDPRFLRKHASLMGDYANKARRYGQRLLAETEADQASSPLPSGVHKFFRSFLLMGDPQGQKQEHTLIDQRLDRICKMGYGVRALHPDLEMARYSFSGCSEHAYRSIRIFQQSLLRVLSHWQGIGFSHYTLSAFLDFFSAYMGRCISLYKSKLSSYYSQVYLRYLKQKFQGKQSLKSFCEAQSFVSSCNIKTTDIISIKPLESNELYYDLQVLENNNYVTVDGTIHHNSGKTVTGCVNMVKGFYEYPGVNQGYFAPSYPQIRDIFFQTIEEVAELMGMTTEVRYGNKEVHFYAGGRYRGTTVCRSMDRPQTILGFKIGHAMVDELDTLPKEKAKTAWRKIIARLRWEGARNGADVTTTPEGFQFVYEQFVKSVREKPELAGRYGYLQASTYDNELNLPEDYIPSLFETYPAQLIEAYLNGQFINLTSGTVYHTFDRRLNHLNETIREGEPLCIGMDFNVGKMAAIVHVKRHGRPVASEEIINAYDTPDMIRRIKERYWRYEGQQYRKTREIFIYPDSSGDSRKTVNASETDIQQLQLAGFRVRAKNANPPVKDRVNAMNAMFCNARGERRYKVNTEQCPVYAESLEQQAWKNGEPDKDTDANHHCDAGGYYIVYEYPIVKPVTQILKVGGA